jgi:hypothetical protein
MPSTSPTLSIVFLVAFLAFLMIPQEWVCDTIINPEEKKIFETGCETGNISTVISYVKDNLLCYRRRIYRCLEISVENNHTDVVRFLFVNVFFIKLDHSLIRTAAKNNNTDMVRLLFTQEYFHNRDDYDTVFDSAIYKHNIEMMQLVYHYSAYHRIYYGDMLELVQEKIK